MAESGGGGGKGKGEVLPGELVADAFVFAVLAHVKRDNPQVQHQQRAAQPDVALRAFGVEQR